MSTNSSLIWFRQWLRRLASLPNPRSQRRVSRLWRAPLDVQVAKALLDGLPPDKHQAQLRLRVQPGSVSAGLSSAISLAQAGRDVEPSEDLLEAIEHLKQACAEHNFQFESALFSVAREGPDWQETGEWDLHIDYTEKSGQAENG